MESRLIDINSRAGRYHFELLQSLKQGKFDYVIGELYATNALLPKKFRITINNKEYNEATALKLIVTCPYCNHETSRDKIKPYNKMQSTIAQIVTKKESIKVWNCSECKKTVILETTPMEQEKLAQPIYLKVVPEPPKREHNLTDRQSYESSMKQWTWLFICELEKSIADYREEYLQRNHTEGEDSGAVPEELQI